MLKTWLVCVLLSIILIAIHSQNLPEALDKYRFYQGSETSASQVFPMVNPIGISSSTENKKSLKEQQVNCLTEHYTQEIFYKNACQFKSKEQKNEELISGSGRAPAQYP